MEASRLDPGTYEGTYKLVGGQLSLDFVNTVSWPGRSREHDWLDRPQNLTVWAVATGLIGEETRASLDARPRAVRERELAQAHDLRADLRALLVPLAEEGWPPASAVERLNERLAAACGRRRIDPVRREWMWLTPTSFAELAAPIVWNAAHVVTAVDRGRVRHCPSCDWLFHDTSRNRSRRWCDMADCGSRAKALSYYRRSRVR